MAEDVSNDISYYLLLESRHRTDLANLWHWTNLKVGLGENSIWIKDLDYMQVNSLEVKTIPYKTVYYSSGGKLFPHHSLLPERNIPSLLWTPIARALPLKLPSFNHNYFGVNEKLSINLVASENEQAAEVVMTKWEILEAYISTASQVRLEKLKWVILNNDKVLIFGKPFLPISGDAFWKKNNFILPAGYDFDLHLLSDLMDNLLNPENDHYTFWNTDNTYFQVAKADIQPLSLSSFRLSKKSIIQQ